MKTNEEKMAIMRQHCPNGEKLFRAYVAAGLCTNRVYEWEHLTEHERVCWWNVANEMIQCVLNGLKAVED